MIITSLKNKQIIEACALKEKKYRDRENKFLIEGYHLIEMCDTIEQIFTTNLNFNSKYPVTYVSEQVMEKLSFTKSPQGIIAIANKKENKIDLNKEKYLICDNVSDPGNLGTIIRSCRGFNIENLIIIKPGVDIFDPKVIRSSMGAIFNLNFAYFNSFEDYINLVQKRNFYPLMLKATTNLSQVEVKEPYSLIFACFLFKYF